MAAADVSIQPGDGQRLRNQAGGSILVIHVFTIRVIPA